MTVITGLTAARMAEIEAACIVSGGVVVDHLILTKKDGSTVDAGNVRGPTGPTGATGPQGPSGSNGFAVRAEGANVSVPNSAVTYHSMTSEDFDQPNSHDNATNPTRLTCTQAGIYLCMASIEYPSNSTGLRAAGLQKNRTKNVCVTTINAATGDSTRVPASGLTSMAVGDYVEVYAYQTSGGVLVTVGTNSFLSMVKVA